MRKASRKESRVLRFGGEVRLSYGTTILAGLLLGSLFDAIYQPGWQPGLIVHLYQLFLGSYQAFWRIHAAVLILPLIFVNLINYGLYRRSRFRSERWFFLFLSIVLNGLIFFAAVNILLCYFD